MYGSSRTTIKNLTGTPSASAQVLAGEGWLSGYTCNATSSGTIALYDALTATGTAVFNATPTASETVILPNIHFKTGCFCTIGGTSINISFYTLEQ